MKAFIVDIDGTVADNKHREHLIKEQGWDAFFEACDGDAPIEHMRTLLNAIQHSIMASFNADRTIVYVTGRPERVRAKTIRWLTDHRFPCLGYRMLMRGDGDHRPDHVIKLEALGVLREQHGLKPIMAFDDRNSVVDMWRANGVPCAQVAPSFD